MRFSRSTATDATLVRAVLHGRTRQFGVLVERYQGLVYSTILSRISRIEEVEDLAQETFLRAFRQLDTLQDPRAFRGWLKQIADHLAVSALRSQKLQQRLPDSPITLPVTYTPEQLFERQETQAQVWSAINQLAEEQREVILLYYYQGRCSVEQLADWLELPPSTVRGRLIRARQELKELLTEVDAEVERAIEPHRPGKAFKRKIMSVLPAVPWSTGVVPFALSRLGGEFGMVLLGMVGMVGFMVFGLTQGWWPEPAQIQEKGVRLLLMPPEHPLSSGDPAALSSNPELSPVARALQEQALQQGWGGQLRWNFAGAEEPQGWVAQKDNLPGTRTLHSEIRDGVWRIYPVLPDSGMPVTFSLVSPIIGHDAALFEQVALRFRVVHSQPSEGFLGLRWTNPLNRTHPGEDKFSPKEPCANPSCLSRFSLQELFQYTGDWQEAILTDLHSRQAKHPWSKIPYNILWEGELIDVRIDLNLGAADEIPLPEAVEIDWIALSGGAEKLSKELPLPPPAANPAYGQLFASPVFYPLGSRPGEALFCRGLGDLDGDGRLDLLAQWSKGRQGGWELIYNDGQQGFGHNRREVFLPTHEQTPGPFVGGADLDGDDLMDLWVYQEHCLQLWFNQGTQGWRFQSLPDILVWEVTDLDGDGDMDMWGWEWKKREQWTPGDEESAFAYTSKLLLNKGRGAFEVVTPHPPVSGYSIISQVQPMWPGQLLNFLWAPVTLTQANRGAVRVVTYQNAEGREQQERLPLIDPLLIQQAGDWDLDGDIDLVTSDHFFAQGYPAIDQGLNFLSRRADGGMDTVGAFAQVQFDGQVKFLDLNGDTLTDAVVVNTGLRNPAVLVFIQQRDGHFVAEGRYPLSEGRGGKIIEGDVDGDGDLDLVVSDSFAPQPGVHILWNRRMEGLLEKQQTNTTATSGGSTWPLY